MLGESLDSLIAANAWLELPRTGDLVLPGDRLGAQGFALWKVPVPWSGPAFTADVLVLALNPGLGLHDAEDQAQPAFNRLVRGQLSGTSPFPWCDPEWAATGGGRYWTPRLRDLVADTSVDAVRARLAVVEWVAYSSVQWVAPVALLDSQLFTRRVVRAAIARGAAIVVARGLRRWTWLVPELQEARPIPLNSPRYVGLSRRNLQAADYATILDRLRG